MLSSVQESLFVLLKKLHKNEQDIYYPGRKYL